MYYWFWIYIWQYVDSYLNIKYFSILKFDFKWTYTTHEVILFNSFFHFVILFDFPIPLPLHSSNIQILAVHLHFGLNVGYLACILQSGWVSPLHAAILFLWDWNFQFMDYFQLVARCIVHACARRSRYTMRSAHIIGPKWQWWSDRHWSCLAVWLVSPLCYISLLLQWSKFKAL